ncbi:hypothetical protein K2F45_02465 [Sphingobacterium siyangense]|uniref:hypothetical protein n=1 Tax=Sphingobacterium TaxID=28453 RepID=UPI0009589C2C|nr:MULTISPECIES: hypothetical protein [Sphingobacterium]APU95555.1 hypothetical protein BV902_03755 [Sphingobacterium sp. B29]UQA75892.1 hypothetical protein K2F45_02465 [Sphingobacterium siyangense]
MNNVVNGSGGLRIENNGPVTKNENQKTTNHIYLHPGERSGEFERWMREIGGLLQIDREYSALKPLLDLIVAVLEPNRIFLIPHPAIEKYQVKPYVEIILVLDGWEYDLDRNEPIVKSVLELVCLKQSTLVFNIFSGDRWEAEMEDGCYYNIAHCRSKFLVFSGSPYRLVEPDGESLENFKDNFWSKFNNRVKIIEHFLEKCNTLLCDEEIVADLAHTLLSSCLKQIYRLVIDTFSLNVPNLNRPCKELEEMAARVLPQLRGQIKKDIDAYINWRVADFEDLDEDTLRMKRHIPDMVELERLLDIAKIAFAQKMVVLFGSNEIVQ